MTIETDGFELLTVFVCVADTRGFTAASVMMGVSKSAVSHAIRQLEKRVGVRLFNRTTRSVGLTEAGVAFYNKVAPLVRELKGAFGDLAQVAATPSGTLRLTMSRSAYVMFIEPLLPQFLAAYPQINLDIGIESRSVDIVNDGYDAGIRVDRILQQDMVCVPLGTDIRMAVVASPDYVARHGVPQVPVDLLRHDCIRYNSAVTGTYERWVFSRDGQDVEIDTRGRISSNDGMTMLKAALDGCGYAYFYDRYVQEYLADGRLVRVLQDWSPRRNLSLYYFSRSAMPQKLRVFIDFLKQHER
ncbi:HTH-type transcriptional regulator PgrR [Pseudomonas fluorescens]|uniref:HTH-type transcriptional regulator PgrR n=1 Tax=Pseudomonas fluorescens TaxID=294 RepID=A0A5E7QYU0_PSEFL|nr:LysR family transcriptional regulator [Pseudomonas fluorescens]VVP66350.1 HTH-type transcriptional regulator PgrR [Pseudomonas fluorescens]